MHKIIFSGKILPGHDPATVSDKLLSMLGLKVEQAAKLFSGKSHTLKKGLSAEEAKRYQDRLNKRGIDVEIVPPLQTGSGLQFPTLNLDPDSELPFEKSSPAVAEKKPTPLPTPLPTLPELTGAPPARLPPKRTEGPPAKRIPPPPHRQQTS